MKLMRSLGRAIGIGALALLMLRGLAAVEAAVYKWVDEKGVTHYSETPPAKARSQEIRIQSPASPAAESASPARSIQQQEAEFQARQKARAEQAANEREASAGADIERSMTEKCAYARARIAALQAHRRSQLEWDSTRGIVTEKSVRAFDKRGEELNSIGKFVDEKCPPEDASVRTSPPRAR